VSFVCRLRDERQFESVDALIAQMHQDVAEAERVLSAER
jgi:FAD synthase